MKKLELRQIIREEISKVLKEASGKIPGLKIEIDQKTGDMLIYKGKDVWEVSFKRAKETNKVYLYFWEGQYGMHFGQEEEWWKIYQKIKDDGYTIRAGRNNDFLLSEYMDPNSLISEIYNKIGGKIVVEGAWFKDSLPSVKLEVNFKDLLSIANVNQDGKFGQERLSATMKGRYF